MEAGLNMDLKLIDTTTGEIISNADAKKLYQRITTIQQAILAGQKLGIDFDNLAPLAIDVLWQEVALGRFLLKMEKNKGSKIIGRNEDKSLAVESDDSQPKIMVSTISFLK